MLSREIMLLLFPDSAAFTDVHLDSLQSVAARRQINTPRRMAAFLSQVGHESAGFSLMLENLNYSAQGLAATWGNRFAQTDAAGNYVQVMEDGRLRRVPNAEAEKIQRKPQVIANRVYSERLGNGDASTGDGWRYRGRGLIQITGKTNYRHCSLGLFGDERLLATPQLLEEGRWAIESAGWYWHWRQVNALAEGDDFSRVTQAINGGLNGHAQRADVFQKALRLLDKYAVTAGNEH